ncbi:MAG TPA: YibE/F family protein [Anaerovoracaceae bacterium]|nr:YibE/F family protein [Anaerovoracaceae bacterium]
MTVALAVILLILLYAVGGERGIVTFISLCFNIVVLSLAIVLMSWDFDPIAVTFAGCLLICSITMFYQNGKNAKTIASFWSVIIVLLILFAVTYTVGYAAHIRGISEIMQREDEMIGLSADINISMAKIAVSMIITGLIGAASDTSIAIASAVYEVYKNNRRLSQKELFLSGTSIGRDIMGATVNTLYFAFIGESLSLLILFRNHGYSIAETVNSKAFFQEFAIIMISCISCILVIPLTAAIISYILKHPEKLRKQLEEDKLFADQPAEQFTK